LIGCYKIIRDSVEDLIHELKKLDRTYRRRGSEHFYLVRDRRFNPARQALFATSRCPSDRYTPQLAAMAIYLNRTGFNGLFRLNSSGLFNVPAGRYANPRICDADNLRRVSQALRAHDVVVQRTSFEVVLDLARPGDFIYFDPPYAPVSSTAHFTAYTADGFSYADQTKLQRIVIELCDRGCYVLLSNSTAAEISELYDGNKYTAAAGLSAHKVAAKRAINSDSAARGTVWEYLITNIQPSR
jgi:DNA adenine methylase